MKLALIAIIWTTPCFLSAADTTLLFQPEKPETGPFPSNFLTEFDPQQKTQLRIKLPSAPACLGAACDGVTRLLNELDGFSVNPQFRVCFSGPIDPERINEGIGIVTLEKPLSVIGIDQIFYDTSDPKNYCVLAKPSRVLDQSTIYLLVVTNRIRAKNGGPIKRDAAFQNCLDSSRTPACTALSLALGTRGDSVESDRIAKPIVENAILDLDELRRMIVGATLFTTMSATDWLQKARTAVNASPIRPTVLQPSVFKLATITKWEWIPHNAGPTVKPLSLPLQDQLEGVDRVAFASFLSPNYLQPTSGSILNVKTLEDIGNPVPIPDPSLAGLPSGYIPISYHVFLPPQTRKTPVVLYAHGLTDNQFGAATAVASTLAKAGFATLAFEVFGHGYGPGGVVALTEGRNQQPTIVSTPGRGIALTPGAPIGPLDGCILKGPLATRDCARQTAVDVFALVRAIKANGLGLDLDPSNIFYLGQSFGSIIGTLVHAVEPDVKAAVFSVGGDSVVDIARLSVGHGLADFYLGTYNLPLYGAVAARAADPTFDFFYTYRGQVQTNSFAGGASIQTAFEIADWLNIPGAPLAYAPHLRLSPLPGMSSKPTLFQFGWGDLEVPNATQTALVRATVGPNPRPNEPLPVSYFTFDKALKHNSELATVIMPEFGLPILPHRILANPTLFTPSNVVEKELSQFVQDQMTNFFLSGGNLERQDLKESKYFDNPKLPALPTLRNYQWKFGPATN